MENVEAMLCAYIDGELDEAGRAEIERHLQNHPQHRKLIDDLIAARKMLRELPRAKAPPDVGDTLRGRMERSILLDDAAAPKAAAARRTSRLPQLLGIAAVLLLCASLGLIVYRVVRPALRPAPLAHLGPTTAPADETLQDAGGRTPSPAATALQGPRFAAAISATRPALLASASPAENTSLRSASGNLGESATRPSAQQVRQDLDQMMIGTTSQEYASSERVSTEIILVRSADPSASAADAMSFFDHHGISYSARPLELNGRIAVDAPELVKLIPASLNQSRAPVEVTVLQTGETLPPLFAGEQMEPAEQKLLPQTGVRSSGASPAQTPTQLQDAAPSQGSGMELTRMMPPPSTRPAQQVFYLARMLPQETRSLDDALGKPTGPVTVYETFPTIRPRVAEVTTLPSTEPSVLSEGNAPAETQDAAAVQNNSLVPSMAATQPSGTAPVAAVAGAATQPTSGTVAQVPAEKLDVAVIIEPMPGLGQAPTTPPQQQPLPQASPQIETAAPARPAPQSGTSDSSTTGSPLSPQTQPSPAGANASTAPSPQ